MPKQLNAEIAKDYLSLQTGLMGRKHLSKDSSMLFDFGSSRPLAFWMKNTYIPLQIAFIDSKGKIGQIESMVPMSTRAVRSNDSYRYALEVNDGWFDENNIKVGATVAFPPDAQTPSQPGQAQAPGQAPGQEQKPAASPDVQITLSNLAILKELVDSDARVGISYQTVGGNDMPATEIQFPGEIRDDGDKNSDNLLVVQSVKDGHPISPHIDLISQIYDPNTKTPITTLQDVEKVKGNRIMTQEDEFSIKGKGIRF
jgi:uncharacterized protein